MDFFEHAKDIFGFRRSEPEESMDEAMTRMEVKNKLQEADNKGQIPTLTNKHITMDEAVALRIVTKEKRIEVSERGGVLIVGDVPEDVSGAVALAAGLVPEIILKKLSLKDDGRRPKIIFSDGSLVVSGKRTPGMIDILKDGRAPLIRLSLENTKLSFGFKEIDKNLPLDPVICFAIVVHEICDWFQAVNHLHDNIYYENVIESDADRAKRHKYSKSENLSNEIAKELTTRIFGINITFGENEINIYTPELN